ncbi:MAG: DUF1566 domain-containing protein [Candidatus Thioglobus sp.]|nr:DUF1566 domain-containing protein [Candidatus Thioglobus sp.]
MNKILVFLLGFCLSIFANSELLKVANSGDFLAKNAKSWNCVLDTKNNLLWEVKTASGLQNSQNTYTWFDEKSGVENGEYSQNCSWKKSCNTQNFIKALNKNQLCQASNWHLPTAKELDLLLIYNDDNPLINTDFFPNTQPQLYWSADEIDADVAIATPFLYGGTRSNEKSFDFYLRGVANVAK